jgi:hypothetical protein
MRAESVASRSGATGCTAMTTPKADEAAAGGLVAALAWLMGDPFGWAVFGSIAGAWACALLMTGTVGQRVLRFLGSIPVGVVAGPVLADTMFAQHTMSTTATSAAILAAVAFWLVRAIDTHAPSIARRAADAVKRRIGEQ